MSSSNTILSVRALIYNGQGNVLFLRRSPKNRRFAGTWEFPGGKVDQNEELGLALVREVREECGLEVEISGLVSYADFSLEGRRLLCLLFKAQVKGGVDVTLSDEHDASVWQTLNSIDSNLILNGVSSALIANQLKSEGDFKPGMKLTLSAKALVHDGSGKYFTIRRSFESKFNAGKWDLPGGKADNGESLDQTLAREAMEESGIDVRVGRLIGCARSVVGDERVVIYVFFLAEATTTTSQLSDEHQEAIWVTPYELVELDVCGQFRGFIEGYFNLKPGGTTETNGAGLITTVGADGKPAKSVNPVWHLQMTQAYSKEFAVYKTYAETLAKVFGQATKKYAPMSIVQSRPKGISSYAIKLVRKASKFAKDPSYHFTDLCGARIICQTEADMERMRAYVRANFTVDEDNSEDTFVRLKDSEFGYRSIHFVVKIAPDFHGIEDDKKAIIGDRKAEIQIRTILQHAWADILHDRMYKGSIKASDAHKRESATIAAMLEKTDMSLSELADELDAYTGDYVTHIGREQLEEELSTATLVLSNEPEEKEKPGHAFKLARLFSQKGEYAKAVEVIEKYPASSNHPHLEAITLCYGELLCMIGSPGSNNLAPCREGLEILKRLLPGGSLFVAYEQSGVPDNRFMKLAGRAAHVVALVYERVRGQEAKAKKHHLLAIKMTPDNPYHMLDTVSFLLAESPNEAASGLIMNQLKRASETCQRHIIVGTELFRAHLALGRIELLLNLKGVSHELEASFTHYLNAISLLLAEPNAPYLALMKLEVEALRRIHRLKEEDEIPLQFRSSMRLLEIGMALVRPDEATELLRRKDGVIVDGVNPVLVVAGSCGQMGKGFEEQLLPVVSDPLCSFHGTLIYGGTLSGASGICAKACEGNPHCSLLGYVPRKIPTGEKLADTGQTVETEGDVFSIAQALAYWSDLIASGIPPTRVRVLGMGYGPISRMEYMLAATIGARVGVLLEDTHGCLINAHLCEGARSRIGVLPAEMETLASFISIPRSNAIHRETTEDLARKIHAKFLFEKRYEHPDESMRPWERLRPDIKESNLSQVRSIESSLAKIGMKLVSIDDPAPEADLKNDPRSVELLSQLEHGRWNAERITSGWRYGKVRDSRNKISPYLVPWKDLPDNIREYDRENVRSWPDLLAGVHMKIAKI